MIVYLASMGEVNQYHLLLRVSKCCPRMNDNRSSFNDNREFLSVVLDAFRHHSLEDASAYRTQHRILAPSHHPETATDIADEAPPIEAKRKLLIRSVIL